MSTTVEMIMRLSCGPIGQAENEQVLVKVFVNSVPGRMSVICGIYCKRLTIDLGALYGMHGVQTLIRQVIGQITGTGNIFHLDPSFIFIRKVRAAALRDKYHDSADIRWLEGNYRPLLIERRDVVNLDYAGLAMKRYPELEFVFNRIGIDVQAAKARVAAVYLSGLPPPQNGDFQQGLHG